MPDEEKQGEESHRQVEHEEDGGEGYAVVEPFGLQFRGRGDAVAAELLLVVGQSAQSLAGFCEVSLVEVAAHPADDVADILAVLGADVVGQFVGGGIPGGDTV